MKLLSNKLVVLTVLVLFSGFISAEPQKIGKKLHTQRIIDGVKVETNTYPFMTALISAEGESIRPFCGAAYVGDRYVLTASHCLEGEIPENINVWIGGTDITKPEQGKRVAVKEIYMHEDYDSGTVNKDVAILELTEVVTGIEPIKIVTPEIEATIKEGDLFTVMGWGNQDTKSEEGKFPDVLHEVQVPLYNRQACLDAYPLEEGSSETSITEYMLCAGFVEGGKDSCQGDSGGPLVIKHNEEWYQAGVVSFGNGCALQGIPGIYSRLSKFNLWLAQKQEGVSYRQTRRLGYVEDSYDDTQTITVTNITTKELSVTNPAIQDEKNLLNLTITDNKCAGVTLATQQSCDILIKTQPTSVGRSEFTLKASTTSDLNTDITVRFSLEAIGPSALDVPEIAGINNAQVSWFSGGDNVWESQASKVSEGDTALASGDILDFESSVLLAKIDSPRAGEFNFDYLVSSEFRYDALNVIKNGETVLRESGTESTEFSQSTVTLETGTNRIAFVYSKDQSEKDGDDKAYLDKIKLMLVNGNPVVMLKETEMSAEEGTSITLDASDSTDPDNDALTFKWEVVGDTQVTIESPEASRTSVVVPKYDDVKSVTFKVTVTDSNNASSGGEVRLTVTAKTTAPTPNSNPSGQNSGSSSGGGTAGAVILMMLMLLGVYRQKLRSE